MLKFKQVIYSFILVIFIITFGCKQQGTASNKETRNTEKKTGVCPYKQFVFKLSSSDEDKIGFPEESTFEIGPNSIYIHSDVVYFLDPLFSRVKAFNLKTDSSFSSVSFSTMNNSSYSWIPRLIDLAFFDNKFYALTNSKSIYVLNNKLELIREIEANCTGQKEFYKASKDTLLIYCVDNENFLNIAKNGNVSEIDADKSFGEISIELGQTYLGKEYEYIDKGDSLYFVTQYGKVSLKEKIQDITLNYYQCKNFGFNSEYFAHFSINPEDNEITFYVYCF